MTGYVSTLLQHMQSELRLSGADLTQRPLLKRGPKRHACLS